MSVCVNPIDRNRTTQRSTAIALVGIVLLGTLLRVIHLGTRSLWIDEGSSAVVARLDLHQFIRLVTTVEANMVLYYALLRFWMSWGDSETFIRALSVLFAVATLPLVYMLGARLFNTRVGLIGALLLSINAFHIRYAQEARGYSLLVFLVTLASLLFLRAVQEPFRRNWVRYSVVCILAGYTHFFAVLVVAGHWLSLGVLRLLHAQWKGLVTSALVIGAFWLPLLFFVLFRDVGQIAWVSYRILPQVHTFLYHIAGTQVNDAIWGDLLLGAYGAASAVAFAAALRARWLDGRLATLPSRLLIVWLVVPVALAIGASAREPVLVPRFLIICLPPLVLSAAAGISALRPNWVRVAGLVAILALSGRSVYTYHRFFDKEDWRSATEYVTSAARAGDAIVFHFSRGLEPFEYYRARLGVRLTGVMIVFPPGVGVVDRRPDLALPTLPWDHYTRVWLVLSHVEALNPKRQAQYAQAFLSSKFPVAHERPFKGDLSVWLYERTDRTAP